MHNDALPPPRNTNTNIPLPNVAISARLLDSTVFPPPVIGGKGHGPCLQTDGADKPLLHTLPLSIRSTDIACISEINQLNRPFQTPAAKDSRKDHECAHAFGLTFLRPVFPWLAFSGLDCTRPRDPTSLASAEVRIRFSPGGSCLRFAPPGPTRHAASG